MSGRRARSFTVADAPERTLRVVWCLKVLSRCQVELELHKCAPPGSSKASKATRRPAAWQEFWKESAQIRGNLPKISPLFFQQSKKGAQKAAKARVMLRIYQNCKISLGKKSLKKPVSFQTSKWRFATIKPVPFKPPNGSLSLYSRSFPKPPNSGLPLYQKTGGTFSGKFRFSFICL